MVKVKKKPAKLIIIYGEKWCVFSKIAKKLASKIAVKVKFVTGLTGLKLKKLLKLRAEPKTIPQIVVDGKYIGGYTGLHSKYKNIL